MTLSESERVRLRRDANDAIWTHHGWIVELRRAIDTGVLPRSPAEVRRPDACAIGAWLAERVPPGLRGPLYETTCAAHARFHAEAAAVLEDAERGERGAARRRLAPGGTFYAAAATMRDALYAWANLAED